MHIALLLISKTALDEYMLIIEVGWCCLALYIPLFYIIGITYSKKGNNTWGFV